MPLAGGNEFVLSPRDVGGRTENTTICCGEPKVSARERARGLMTTPNKLAKAETFHRESPAPSCRDLLVVVVVVAATLRRRRPPRNLSACRKE